MLDNGNVGHQLPFLPLSNDTVRRHIDETAKDVQSQLNDIIQTTNFSSLEESNVRDSKAFLEYARFKHSSKFLEEMFFCKSLKTNNTARDIYAVLK